MEPSCQGLDSAEKSDSQGGGFEIFQRKISEYPLLSDSFDGLQIGVDIYVKLWYNMCGGD